MANVNGGAQVLSAEEEKQKIKEIIDATQLKAGQEWCVMDFKWFQMWQQYVSYDGEGPGDGQRPGPLDNSALLDLTEPTETDVLKKELRENYDYALVPKQAYQKFVLWYGGGPTISRIVINAAGTLRVDLHPLRIKWKKYGGTTGGTAAISKHAPVKELRHKLAPKLNMPPHKVRLWAVEEDTNKPVLLDEDGKSLADCQIEDGDNFIVEIMANDGHWPMSRDEGASEMYGRSATAATAGAGYKQSYAKSAEAEDDGLPPVGSVNYSASNPNSQLAGRTSAVGSSYGRTAGMTALMGLSSRERYKNTEGTTTGPGLCGLNNLGNTCFMNSALQCLSNTVPLTNFFLSNEFVKDINRTNILGMKGQLADHYSILLKELWSSKYRVVAPAMFKYMLGKFAPQFSGYQQHDSQELLAFLLDGLHEDMNRVITKPYVETVESNGRADEEVAAEAWEAHLKRNKSIIVDLFQGQFKSTVVCPVCSKVSITFDPFMYLSVPLPVANDRVMQVTCIYLERPPLRYGIKLSKNGIVTDIKKAMAEVTGLGIEQMGICDIYAHKIFKILPENHPVKQIRDSDEIFCFEIVANDEKLPPEKLEKRKAERKAAKLARKAKRLEDAKNAAAVAGEPMETDDGPKAGEDVEMKDKEAEKDQKEKEKEGDGEKEDVDTKTKQKEKGKQKAKKKLFYKYVSVLHRELRTAPMRKGRRYELFGYPFVLSVDPEFVTNRQLYDMIWYHIQKIYRKEGQEVAAEDPQVEQEKRQKLEQEVKERTDLHEEEVRGLLGVGPYPFTLYIGTNHNFTASGMTQIPLNDEIHGPLPNAYKVHFNVDWTDAGIEKYFDKKKIAEHPSVKELKAEEEKAIELSSCLELFTKTEKLSADDAWYCNKCQEHREATKKFDVWKVPKIMVVHLKRFQFTKLWRDKIEQLVDFPEVLDMSPYVVGPIDQEHPPIYSLFAVSNHSGAMGFGHYTAYAKNRKDGKWYHFNDSSVSEASPKEIVSSNAYVLFYERKDIADTPYVPFEFSQEEVDAFLKKSQEEMEAEREKEREKERAKYGQYHGHAATAANRAGRSSLDDIDDAAPSSSRTFGPHLPGHDPMDTEYPVTAATAAGAGYPAGYDPDEESDAGLRSRKRGPQPGLPSNVATAVAANVAGKGDAAAVFAAATGHLPVYTPGNVAGVAGAGPNPNFPYPAGPLDEPIDPMHHDKSD